MLTASMTAQVQIGSNIQDMIDYLDSLEGVDFEYGVRRIFESESNLRKLNSRIHELIQRLIYDRQEEGRYKRTGKLLESFYVSSGNEDNETGFVVISDPTIAEAKIPSGPDQSYAVFFERPDDYKTFIKPRGQAVYPVNYRPFFTELYNATFEHAVRAGSKAISKTAQELRPQSLRLRVSS